MAAVDAADVVNAFDVFNAQPAQLAHLTVQLDRFFYFLNFAYFHLGSRSSLVTL